MDIKKSDCVYIERVMGDYNKLLVTEYIFGTVKMVKILQTTKRGRRKIEKDNKRLIKVLRKYCDEKTVIAGNEAATLELEISNQLFWLRKRELQSYAKDIISHMGNREEMVKSRRVFLLVLESDGWNQKEVTELLWMAKDYYEDLYLLVKNVSLHVENLVEFFYVECGVVIHITTEKAAKQMQVDFGLFLLERWSEQYKKYYFRRGYVVSEWEEGLKRKRKNLKKLKLENQHLINRELYTGFVYEYAKKQLSYEEGLLLSNNRSLQNKIQQEETENPISIVAIYGVE